MCASLKVLRCNAMSLDLLSKIQNQIDVEKGKYLQDYS